MNLKKYVRSAAIAVGLTLAACSNPQRVPIQPVPNVSLPRFVGDWYVIACIPTFIETEAYNAIESYRLKSDGSIATTFTFNQGSLSGPRKSYHPTGYVAADSGNAVWGMQFIWPFKSEYIIAYLDPEYRMTIIARNARDYVWYMARTPTLSDADYQAALQRIAAMQYPVQKIRKVEHGATEIPAAAH